MLILRHLTTIIFLFFIIAPTAHTQNLSSVVNDFSIKFFNYATDYKTKSTTLLQYKLTDEASILSDLGDIAVQYAALFDHISDLIDIYQMSSEVNVKNFCKKKIMEKKTKGQKGLHDADIKYIDSVIELLTVESIKEKTIEFRKDLIAVQAIIETL